MSENLTTLSSLWYTGAVMDYRFHLLVDDDPTGALPASSRTLTIRRGHKTVCLGDVLLSNTYKPWQLGVVVDAVIHTTWGEVTDETLARGGIPDRAVYERPLPRSSPYASVSHANRFTMTTPVTLIWFHRPDLSEEPT